MKIYTGLEYTFYTLIDCLSNIFITLVGGKHKIITYTIVLKARVIILSVLRSTFRHLNIGIKLILTLLVSKDRK